MFTFYVNVKVVGFVGSVSAEWARITVFSLVDATVFTQRAAVFSPKRTIGTGVGSLPRVCAYVFLEVVRVSTDVPAIGAAVPLCLPICLIL